MHGFVCKEWVFWMDDSSGTKLKKHLESVTDDKLIQSLKALFFGSLEKANDNFNGLLHNFGCPVQSMACMLRSYLPKTTELTFYLYDALTPKAPEIKLEQFTAQTILEPGLEKETLDPIAEIGRIDPEEASTILYDMDSTVRMHKERAEQILRDLHEKGGDEKGGGYHK